MRHKLEYENGSANGTSTSVYQNGHSESAKNGHCLERHDHNHNHSNHNNNHNHHHDDHDHNHDDKHKKMDRTSSWSKWMNPRPKGRCAYNPTVFEHYANVFTHGTVILPSIIGTVYLINFSKTHAQYKSSLVYGLSLILLFTISTLFHLFSLLQQFRCKKFFHYCDRATIYIFIASSYTPWLYLRSTNTSSGEYMIAVIWICAFLGVAYQLIFHEKYKALEVVFYISIGVLPSLVVIDMVDVSGLTELAIGGSLYLIGLLFFKSDGVIPFAHAIWHVFVCSGAIVHYYAIFKYLIK